VQASDAVKKQLGDQQEKAVSDLNNPGRIGYGAEAITLGLMRLLESGDTLNRDEQLLASQIAIDAVSASGLLDVVKAQVRAEVLAEQEQAAKDKPMMRCGGRGDAGPPRAARHGR
jgi:hypothetical protein